jgi:hypothetical protein
VALDITEGKLVSQGNLGDSVPTRRLSMRKIKEVLRLRFELGLGQREIARACALSQGAVHNYLKRAAETGMPLPEGRDVKRIEETVFGKQCSIEEPSRRAFPDFPALHQQLQQHPHLILQLVWEEYREKSPEGYHYSWFCELYRQWRGKQDVVLRQEHKAGGDTKSRPFDCVAVLVRR